MNKYLALCFALFVALLLPRTVSAHTDLKSSTPAKDETVTTAVSEITLSFATEIEPVVVLKVTDASNKEIPVKIEAGEDQLTGVLDAPLADGAYTVNWRIIGEDGHNIKGNYSFTVALPAEAAPAPDTAMTPENASDSSGNTENTSTQADTQTEQNEAPGAANTSESVNPSDATDQTAEDVVPEQFVNAADKNQSNKNKTWTEIGAVGCLVLLFFLFRAIMKK
ncbi:copper resistance CopC family protein [Paenibacillus lignilyticus]|uniref:Copper resistance protein CopC n=1 Tax=Paenibacillus lignilyticus TaxID=1172615 RepID=A0ABS5CB70_9BACL|nr:copper resistance protein CopC [Paenibacillus lignilyticus]MBP3963075.1 copper resistance protein CopC [Paenibacillus lignilyticus]